MHLREARVRLPTFAEVADPSRIAPAIAAAAAATDPDEPRAANLFRVHWFNGRTRRERVPVPEHVVLPPVLTGVPARIVVLLGAAFPLIAAHKVLAAYACLAPRLVTGQFDPTVQRAIWPSTGNYCRGGVAISRILGCRGVAVLPAGMSEERFDWLGRWVRTREDVVRTPGTESNVKEIYDECAALARDPANVVLNQFSEFGNYLVHYACTGRALERVFEALAEERPRSCLAAFVAGTGSAGTLGAGDYLKDRHRTRIVAVEPLQCPTLLYNGYGEHNIQGIGDKHVPLIHNVMNTDVVAAISDAATDELDVLFNTEAGRDYLQSRRGLESSLVADLGWLGYSGIANCLAAIKVARRLDLDEDDVVATVATDSAALYASERRRLLSNRYGTGFDRISAAEVFARHWLGCTDDHVRELDARERRRAFNLGYFTWVEQQGVAVEDFDRRRHQRFWRDLRELLPVWDELIEAFNRDTGIVIPGGPFTPPDPASSRSSPA